MPQTLATRVQHRLTALGLSREAASRQAGLNVTYVRDLIEGRTRTPLASKLARLASALKTTPEWLLEGRGEKEPSKEQLEFERVQAVLRRIAPEDLPQAERALRGFVRDADLAPFTAQTPAPKSRRKTKP